MFKFIHTADIHLDSPLRGLSHYEGAPEDTIRGATREALKGLVRTAIDEEAAFVVIAGDLFDGEWNDYSQNRKLEANQHAQIMQVINEKVEEERDVTELKSMIENVFVNTFLLG